jgi:hypothetical protein
MRFILAVKMKSKYESSAPLLLCPLLAVSTSIDAGMINCRNLDKIAVSCAGTFAAESDADLTVSLYYSPDGKTFDTETFDSLTLTDVASTVVQKSKLVSVPDTGWIKIVLTNGSSQKTISALKVWASVVYKFVDDRQTEAST